MGIYIPGMEMPEACCACPCSRGNQCAVNNKNPTFAEWYEAKPNWCPLIPVPDHGRLVDGDALAGIHRTKAYENGGRRYSFHATAKAWVDEAPTIIPASKEGEG